MSDLHLILNSILFAAQVGLSFTAAFVLMLSRHKHTKHSYLAGITCSLWAGAMLSYGTWSVLMWPVAIDSASLFDVVVCGVSAGLAIYSGGSIFKVIRLCRRLCG